jgi:2-polyprenyl-6-methoxyphenol hydroxylase-like FAD-dependent oxidoreductase
MRVLVVGGGIGGLSATIALRERGIDVDVVERDPAWSVYGVGIIQPGNALRALAMLGLAEQCVEAGHPIVGSRVFLADGETLVDEAEFPTMVEGLPAANGIPRPHLHEILTSRTRQSGARVRTGVTVTELSERAGAATVICSDGSTDQYDLVIGADGLYSQIRSEVFEPDLSPKFTGQICWRVNLPRLDGLDEIQLYLGPDGSAGFVPLGQELMYMLTIETPIAGWREEIERVGAAALYRERLKPFRGVVAQQRELVVDDDAVVVRPIEDILVAPPWHRGRVVLVGDAAHGMTPHCGQGAAQAIEDGIVLADELASCASIDDALQAYSDRRYDRCREIFEGSERIGLWEQDHTLAIDPAATRMAVAIAAGAPL